MKLVSFLKKQLNFLKAHKNRNLSENDVWYYFSRPHESQSTLSILKIEEVDGIEIVHIRIDGLKVKNPNSETGFSQEIHHMPFKKDTLIKSLTKKIGSISRVPDFSEGYKQWKEANGGVFNIPVKDAVSFIEESINAR